MAAATRKRGRKLWLTRISPDRVALAAGMFAATAVCALGFWREVQGIVVALRAAISFGVIYVSVYILVLQIQRIIVREQAEAAAREAARYREGR